MRKARACRVVVLEFSARKVGSAHAAINTTQTAHAVSTKRRGVALYAPTSRRTQRWRVALEQEQVAAAAVVAAAGEREWEAVPSNEQLMRLGLARGTLQIVGRWAMSSDSCASLRIGCGSSLAIVKEMDSATCLITRWTALWTATGVQSAWPLSEAGTATLYNFVMSFCFD